MGKDKIREIGIDEKKKLYIVPNKAKFPFIYREALDVHWDENLNRLHSSVPREWTYAQWYNQIIKAAKECGVLLCLSDDTKWIGFDDRVKSEITSIGTEG